ncbi:MAG: T9SS type A sorting domain-containing protein [Ignavibacteriales bacterium]|nr:T9SS type A sorting domain-containing protein [Ignavibacteriales bacterium]
MLIYWKDRSITLDPRVGGVAGLGFWDTITKDGIDIISSNGVLGFKAQDYGNEHTIWVSAHEIGHHQFGMIGGNNGSHFNGRADNYGNIQRFGLMTRGDGHQFSAYERYRLGWLDPIVVSSNTNNIVLNETHKSSSNNAILIPVKYNTSDDLEEYFLLENYHTTNAYAEANPFLIQSILGHTISKGIIAYHVSAENFDWPTLSRVDIESAEGLFAWEVIQGASTPSDRLDDLIAPGIVNLRNGFDERDTITATAGTITYRDYYALTPETTTNLEEKAKRRYNSDDYLGDQEDLFNTDYNKIFTKWSNPSSIKDDGSDSNVGFEIVSYNSSTHTYTLNVAVNSTGIQEFAPSKPQNLHLTYADQNHPSLGWDVNTESDISSYKIYRNYNNGGWVSAGTVTHPTNTFVDNMVDYTKPIWEKAVKYYVVAVDNTSKTSVPSTQVETSGIMNQIPKVNEENYAEENAVEEVVHNFKLYDNYPDPFNPTTKIKYQLPEAGMVTLKIYDILGREVAELVNENKSAGYYEVSFDASKLTSGVYIYTIQANKYTESKKMILAK